MTQRGPISDRLSWDDLRTALSLARSGSVRRAARMLGVSHSTVLRRVHGLQTAAGVELFVLKEGGYELTPAGQDVFDTATEVEEVVQGLERRVAGRDLKLSGPVRLTLPDLFLPWLMPLFADLARTHPGIDVTLAVGTGFADLAHRAADVAIRATSEPPADLVGRRLANACVGIYGSESYLANRQTRNLEALDWVGWEAGSQMAFARWMEKNVPRARIAVRVGASWALREGVDAGIGVAIVPCALGETRPGWRRVRLVPEANAPLWILTHRDLRTTARVSVVRDFISDAIVEQRDIVEGTRRQKR